MRHKTTAPPDIEVPHGRKITRYYNPRGNPRELRYIHTELVTFPCPHGGRGPAAEKIKSLLHLPLPPRRQAQNSGNPPLPRRARAIQPPCLRRQTLPLLHRWLHCPLSR